MLPQVLAIARLTILEAVRTRMLWLTLAILAVGLALAAFTGAVSLTESAETQVVLLASTLRWSAVLLLALFSVASVVREINDKVVEHLLSLPVPRSAYYFGKLAGFSVCAISLAALYSVPLLLFAEPPAVGVWGLSLGAELILVACMGLFALFTFSQIPVALVLVLGFYVLGRGIGAFQLMARGPLTDPNDMVQRLGAWAVDAIAYLVPDLYRFTRSDWLVSGGAGAQELGLVWAQTMIYGSLLAGVALVDLYRREL